MGQTAEHTWKKRSWQSSAPQDGCKGSATGETAEASWKNDGPHSSGPTIAQSTSTAGEVSHYEVLGVKSDAPVEEIKAAYASLAKKLHTDKDGSPHLFMLVQNLLKHAKRKGEKENVMKKGCQS